MYSPEPADKEAFTKEFDRTYSRFARLYDLAVKWLPVWRTWIRHTLPHIRGPRVLEVSFGTGYLLSQYANECEAYGIDYNWQLACTAGRNLEKAGAQARIQQADINALPYRPESFDTVVNTMAFSGYPDGERALSEIRRVLKHDGRFVLIDVNYPRNKNWLGIKATQFWASAGDLVRDMAPLFERAGFTYTDQEVGGFGSIHLYIAMKEK